MSFSARFLAFLLLGALAAAAAGDVRTRTISNRLTTGIALAAPLWWWATGLPLWPDAAWQVGFAGSAFLLFAGVFAVGLMGGGDVKLIAALALWFPFDGLVGFLTVMAYAGAAVSLVMLVIKRVKRTEVEVPYGVAIAAGGAWSICRTLF